MYSSEEEEQSQGEGNVKVEVDNVLKSFNQFFSEEIHHINLSTMLGRQMCNPCYITSSSPQC